MFVAIKYSICGIETLFSCVTHSSTLIFLCVFVYLLYKNICFHKDIVEYVLIIS